MGWKGKKKVDKKGTKRGIGLIKTSRVRCMGIDGRNLGKGQSISKLSEALDVGKYANPANSKAKCETL